VASQLRGVGQACDAYRAAFGAFPGPVPDDITAAHNGFSVVDTTVSQSENLLLGLRGCLLPDSAEGLRDEPTPPETLVDSYAEPGIKGPFKRIPIYDEDGQWRAKTGMAHFYDPAPREMADVNEDGLPELISPAFARRPILYYRAVPARPDLQYKNADAELSMYDYRQNGLSDHGYDTDPKKAPPNQARLAAMVWDKSSAQSPTTFTEGDQALRSDSYVLIAAGPDGQYADNTLTDDTDVPELAEPERDNITNIR
jgi:hypothetical protein